MKRFVAILVASGALAAAGAALAPVAFADPANGNANCIAEMTALGGGYFVTSVIAQSSASDPGPDRVGVYAATDCIS